MNQETERLFMRCVNAIQDAAPTIPSRDLSEAYLEIFFYKDDFSRIEIAFLVERAKKFFKGVRVVSSPVYSYQGGNHGSNSPETRPDDWVGSFTGDGDARDGDYLLCLGTEDRYGYAVERSLFYKETSNYRIFDFAKLNWQQK